MCEFHSITLDTNKCLGCTNCMKNCPTGALRVRGGKASINYEKCISCGNCVRSCPAHAITAQADSYDALNAYKFKVALVPSCLYAQFPHLSDTELILNSVKNIGFDYAYEVARASDLLSMLKREMFIMGENNSPVISTVCPACVELILTKYHCLKEHLIDHLAPLCLAAKEARAEVKQLYGLEGDDVGVFYITPCPAKAQAIKTGFYSSIPEINGAVSVGDTCKRLAAVKQEDVAITQELKASSAGVSWSTSGGEAASFPNTKQLAADGIYNVISILRELEDGKLHNIDFIELHACHNGCVGGVLNVTNPFVAKSKIHTLRRTSLLNKTNVTDTLSHSLDYYKNPFAWQVKDVYKLDADFSKAMAKMQQVEEILTHLPHLDCGVCGSPSCRAFAEDVVQGQVDETACIMFK